MSLSPSSRRLFVPPLAGVERHGSGTLGGGGAVVGIPSLFLRTAPRPSGAKLWSGK